MIVKKSIKLLKLKDLMITVNILILGITNFHDHEFSPFSGRIIIIEKYSKLNDFQKLSILIRNYHC